MEPSGVSWSVIKIIDSQLSILKRMELGPDRLPELVYTSGSSSDKPDKLGTRLVRFSDIDDSLNKYNSCPISKKSFREKTIVEKMNCCGHYFDPDAIHTWLTDKSTCPLCSKKVVNTHTELEEPNS